MFENTRRNATAICAALLIVAIFSPLTAQEQEPQEPIAEATDAIPVTVQVSRSGDSTRVILTHGGDTTKAVLFHRGRIEVVYTDPIRVEPATGRLEDDVLAGWQMQGDRRIEFLPGETYRSYETFDLRNPDRLIIDIRGGSREQPRGGAAPPVPSRPQFVIVIDPGHGGIETGAVGANGLKEKEVALDLARRLKQQMSGHSGVSVVLTRDEDQHLELDERTAIANHNRADLFISIHLNASPRRAAFGAETYYLSADATDEEAREAAAIENRMSGRLADGETRTLELVLWDMAQNKYLAQSSRLAESVQSHLNRLTGTRDRGVRQAPFRVLMGATMPAILVEVGFVSNPSEEEKLRTLGYRERIVEALANAVAEFMFDARRVSGPAAGPAATGN